MERKLQQGIHAYNQGQLGKALERLSDVWLDGDATQKRKALEYLHKLVDARGATTAAPDADIWGPRAQVKPIFEIVNGKVSGVPGARASAAPGTSRRVLYKEISAGGKRPVARSHKSSVAKTTITRDLSAEKGLLEENQRLREELEQAHRSAAEKEEKLAAAQSAGEQAKELKQHLQELEQKLGTVEKAGQEKVARLQKQLGDAKIETAERARLETELAQAKENAAAKKLEEEAQNRSTQAPTKRDAIDLADAKEQQVQVSAPSETAAAIAQTVAASEPGGDVSVRDGLLSAGRSKSKKRLAQEDVSPLEMHDAQSGAYPALARMPEGNGAKLSIDDELAMPAQQEETRGFSFKSNDMELDAKGNKELDKLGPALQKPMSEIVIRGLASPSESNPERLAKVRAHLIEKLVKKRYDVASSKLSVEWGVGVDEKDQKVLLVIRR